MDKRTFLKTSSLAAGGALISGLASCGTEETNSGQLTNWAGNVKYSTSNVHFPATVEELQELVRKYDKVTVLGSRHSFNRIADSKDRLLSVEKLNKVISLDARSATVTVESGIKYGELAPFLDEHGFALHNLASLPHISIAGAVATATHGSGLKNGNLSTAVSEIEFINAAGEIGTLSKKKDVQQFNGAIVSLGALGAVTKLTLELQPASQMHQVVYRNLPMDVLKNDFLQIMSMGYSVSFFTDWKNRNISEVWIKSRVTGVNEMPAPELSGAKLATQNLHPIETEPAENCTEQMGIHGKWYERLPHFKMGFKPSAGKELQSEYFVPVEHAYEAMMAMEKLSSKISPHLFISEIRTVQADDLWMSPCYKRTCVALHTTWKQKTDAVMALLPVIEQQLARFDARPHWAKLFTLPPKVLQARYEQLPAFKELARHYDPKGKFRNEFLSKNIFSE